MIVYDTCVLVPAPLRYLLLRVAEAGLVRATMSDDILDELERVLVRDLRLEPAHVAGMRAKLATAYPECTLPRARYASQMGTSLPDASDEHVLAAARASGADTILTMNLRDFPSEHLGRVVVKHPEELVIELCRRSPEPLMRILRAQAAALRDPPIGTSGVIDALASAIPGAIPHLRSL